MEANLGIFTVFVPPGDCVSIAQGKVGVAGVGAYLRQDPPRARALAAFGAFRLFDVAKPPPIRYFERRYSGGFGVMFDDLVAAGYALILLAAVQRLLFFF